MVMLLISFLTFWSLALGSLRNRAGHLTMNRAMFSQPVGLTLIFPARRAGEIAVTRNEEF